MNTYQSTLNLKNRNSIYLFALCIAYFVSLALNSEWIVNFIGWVDGWAYFGGMYNPIRMRTSYPDHPLGDLLPLLLTGAAYYQIFPPLVANVLYKLTCFVVPGFLMLKMLESEFGIRTAILGTVTFISSKYFLGPIGSDYTEGRVIIFYLASLFFVLKATNSDSKNEKFNLFFGGVSYSFTVSTALLSIVYSPGIGVLYFAKKWIKLKKFDSTYIKRGLFFLYGFASGVIGLCVIHFCYTGQFIYFYNTFEKAGAFLRTGRAAPVVNLANDWLAVPIYTIVVAIVVFVQLRRTFVSKKQMKLNPSLIPKRGHSLIFVAASLTNLVILSYLQIYKNQGSISDLYYFNQTIPLTILAASAVFFAPWVEQLSRNTFRTIALAFTCLSFFIFWYSTNFNVDEVDFIHFSNEYGVAVLVCFGFLALIKNKLWITTASLVFLSLLNLAPRSFTSQIHRLGYATPAFSSRHQYLASVVDWIEQMNRLDPQRKAFLWYDRVAFPYLPGLSSASHFWQGRIYNEYFPNVNVAMGEQGVISAQRLLDRPLIILSSDKALLMTALSSLEALQVKAECEIVGTFTVPLTTFDIYKCASHQI